MSIANPKQSVLSFLRLEPRVLLTKILLSAAIAVISCIGVAAPAGAVSCVRGAAPVAGSGPFGILSCSCRETAPARDPALREEIKTGNPGRLRQWVFKISSLLKACAINSTLRKGPGV